MSDRRLTASFRDLAEVLVPEEELEIINAARAVIRGDATLRSEVVGQALLLPLTFRISGTAAVGTNVAEMIRLPQNATISRVDADAKTAPSGGEFTAQLTADGAAVSGASVSIVAGQTSGGSNVGTAVSAGARLSLDVYAANLAANISITVTLRVTS